MLIRTSSALLLAVLQTTTLAGTPLEEATQAFRAGAYPTVLEHAAAVERGAEDWPRVQYLAGEAALILGRTAEAQSAFENVLSVRTQAVPAQVGLGRALTLLGRTNEAESMLNKALTAEPGDIGARIAMAELLGGRGAPESFVRAREMLEAVIEAEPGNPFAARALVVVLMRSDLLPEAAGVAEALVEVRPKHPMGYFLLALAMERDGEDELAIGLYQDALEKDPKFLDAHKNLAILCHTLSDTYQRKDRTVLAFEHYERYFELGGQDKDLARMFATLKGFKEKILGS